MNSKKDSKEKDVTYKYLIHHYLNLLPHHQYKVTTKYLPLKLGISAETFRKWKYIKLSDSATIPADKLAIIANFFQLRIEDIFNYEIPNLNYKELEKEDQINAQKNRLL